MTTTMLGQCPQHAAHVWEFRGDCPRNLRAIAQSQIASLCPSPGDVLTFCPIMADDASPVNWALRRCGWNDLDELIVAVAGSSDAPSATYHHDAD